KFFGRAVGTAISRSNSNGRYRSNISRRNAEARSIADFTSFRLLLPPCLQMSSPSFDFASLLPAGLPPPAVRWTGRVKFDFTGGNNGPDRLPLDGLIAAADAVLRREGRTLSTYGLSSGPQGYRALREFLVGKLKADAGIVCTADDILMTSGS